MLNTEITYAIANSSSLRLRTEALVQQKLATVDVTNVERELCSALPSQGLMWSIAANATVLNAVVGALEAHDGNVEATLSAVVPDGDLEYIVLQQVTCLLQ